MRWLPLYPWICREGACPLRGGQRTGRPTFFRECWCWPAGRRGRRPPTVAGERMLALRTAMPLLRDRKHRSGVGAAYMPPAPSRKRPFTVHTRANNVRPYILYPGSLCNAGLWRCSLCGGVRAPRPTSSGTAVRRAAYPQAAVQCGGYGNVPGASRTPPPTVAGERMPALHGRAGHARPASMRWLPLYPWICREGACPLRGGQRTGRPTFFREGGCWPAGRRGRRPLPLPGNGCLPYTAGPGLPGPYGAARENGHKKSHRRWETVGNLIFSL